MKNSFIAFMLLIVCATACSSETDDHSQSGSNTASSTTTTSSTTSTFSEQGFDCVIKNGVVKITKCWDYGLSISIPEQIAGEYVNVVGTNAFYQHAETVSIVLPQSLKTIESSAFYRCYSLLEITIPKNVNQIDSNPFFRCSSLSAISVDPENDYYTDIDGVLYNKDQTELIAYPEGKTATRYTIPNSVKSITGDAFGYYCAYLKELVILSNVVNFPDGCMFIFPDDIKLVVEPGSAAEEYALRYELNFELLN